MKKQSTHLEKFMEITWIFLTPVSSYFTIHQGPVWILDLEKVPKNWISDKGSREQKRKIDVLEVNPVRKYANLKDQALKITEPDGSSTVIQLKNCSIAAVSATNLPSRKWAKKYPIKVETETSAIYNGSKSLYIYLETSVEKESWSKALRISSCSTNKKLKSFVQLRTDFQNYLTALNTEHPSLMKPTTGFNAESIEKSIKIDGSSSKVRHFLKKLAKKTSKSGSDYKANSELGRGGKNVNEKSRLLQESAAKFFVKPTAVGKVLNSLDENAEAASITRAGSTSSVSVISEADSDDRLFSDEGTLCWNLLLSRLFFDAKSNSRIKSFAQARIQRSLSNIRTPSYIGEVMCTGVHLGNLPPYIHGMRVLPSDMNDIMALELDIEYRGGAVLDIETRVEVCGIDISENMTSNLDPTSVDEVTSDLLEGIEHYGNQFKLSKGEADKTEARNEGNPKFGKMKSFKSSLQESTYASKWRSMINTVAKQVSEVPISLGIRVASLRGTLRLEIKAPPSDQIWLAFTSVPDIDLNLESSVGEHKITNGHIALFLINRFKAAIRETMVLPNYENIYIPFMIAENDDWLPRQAAPFIWVNQEASTDSPIIHEKPSSQHDEGTQLSGSERETHSKTESNESKIEKADGLQLQTKKSVATPSESTNQSSVSENPIQELKTPLLGAGEPEEIPLLSKEEHVERQEPTPGTQSPSRSSSIYDSSSRSSSIMDEETHSIQGDESRPKRMGNTRAKMLGLGKKMGEKLEERRRHIEEKGRNIVERMRAPDKAGSQ
ncbi:uncharacterized protein LOC108214989 isoform X2 [Daucus carota subsp. sativus]|uniref:uncharacterized protein LOC108214989 isoform X2 n=1 Tax=Daucus carota subsp. sativus TaxID=79200 RepID=UPI0007EF236A|nr:PREDICTED: testis-expressed sequence 2 protein-like isoform X2 [Daucus carota subsp. sativus]